MKPDEVYEYAKENIFKRKIEEASVEEVRKVLELAYNAEMPELVAIPYFGLEEEVSYTYEELVALCPMTGIMDAYKVTITYTPNQYVCELKSLRFYFLAYRNLPITHELLLSKIWREFKEAVKPKSLKIELEVAVRGGVKTIIRKEWKEEVK